MRREAFQEGAGVALAIFALAAIFGLLIFGSVAGCGAVKDWQRTQKRKNAENSVRLTGIYVKRQQQEAKRVAARDAVVQALADQRVIEAHGVRKAQDIIAQTLTPMYLQHEAIRAQLAMAHSQNHTVVYVPSGDVGVPLVQNATHP